MDIGWFRSVMTAVLFVAFVGIVLWAWSSRRRDDFQAAARLAVDDHEDDVVSHGGAR